MSEPTLGELAEELASIDDPHARSRARAFASSLLEMHGESVARLLALIADGDASGEILSTALADPMVASLLILHDLHPESMAVRVERAVAQARQQLGPLGANLADPVIDGDVVTVTVDGPADSPQAMVGIEAVLARLVRQHAPDAQGLRVAGASDAGRGGRPLLPLVQLS